MKKYLNKLLAFLLVIAMTATLLPESVCAAYRFDPSECPAARFHSDPESTDPENYHWKMTDVSNATCTEDGWYELTCVYCGYKARVTGDRAYGHSWTGWVDVTTATCTEKGQRKRSCLNCGLQEDDYTSALGHSWGDWKTTKEADCKTEGQKTRTCLRCQETDKQSIAALGHSWGDWKTEKEPDCENEGQKVRTCSRCQETEKQSIPANGHTPGEWQLGEDGTCQKVCSVCQKVLETTEIIEEVTEEKEATSNGNGTHDFKLYEITQKYYTNENGEKVAIGDPERELVQEATETCAISNSELACSDCGYQSNLMAWLSMFGEGDLTNIALMWKRPPYDLPWVENLTYSHPYFYWDAVEGAVRYAVTIKEWEDGSAINSSEITSENTWVDLSEYVTTGKEYAIFVVALDKEDTMASEETDMLICIEEEEGPQKIAQVQVKGRTVYWTPINNPGNYGYRVSLRKWCSGEGNVCTFETTGTDYTIPKSYLEVGCYYCASVQYIDMNGVEPDSEWTISDTFLYNPTLYMLNYSANVRSGPGKFFERLGGLAAGTVIEADEVKNGYVRFDFDGVDGWVTLDALRISSTETYDITMKVECKRADNTTYVVTEVRSTDEFGRVDMSQPANAYYSGCVFAGWNKEGASETASVLPEDTEFTADTTLEGFWTHDESKVMLQYDAQIQDFDSTTSFYVTKGQTIGESATMPLLTSWNGVPLEWYTGPNGTGEKVDNSYVIPEDYGEYYMTLYGMPAEKNWTKLTAPAYLYNKYSLTSNVIEELEEGDEVLILSSIYLNSEWLQVRTRNNNIGYLINAAQTLSITPVVTFDAGEGYTPVAYMKTIADTYNRDSNTYVKGRLPYLPEAKRDGYYFIGWFKGKEEESDVPVSISDGYLKDTVLYARYVKISDTGRRVGLIIDEGEMLVDDGVSWKWGPKYHLGQLIQITGQDGHLYDGIVNGINGRVYDTCVTFNYYEAEIPAGQWINLYTTSRMSALLRQFGARYGGNQKVYIIGESGNAYKVCWYVGKGEFDNGETGIIGWAHKSSIVNKKNYSITFDANGGIVTENGMPYYTRALASRSGGTQLGDMPKAEMENCSFLGWYTEPYLGTKVTSKTTITSDMTLYAHYRNAATPEFYFVLEYNVPLLKEPKKDSAIIMGLDAGYAVSKLDSSGQYYYVNFDGRTGYVDSQYLKKGQIMVSSIPRSDVYDTQFRGEPTRKSTDRGTVPNHTCFLVIGYTNGYYRVSYQGKDLYVSTDLLIDPNASSQNSHVSH